MITCKNTVEMLSINLRSCFTVPLSRSLDSDDTGSATLAADPMELGSVSMDLEDDESMDFTGNSFERIGELA